MIDELSYMEIRILILQAMLGIILIWNIIITIKICEINEKRLRAKK